MATNICKLKAVIGALICILFPLAAYSQSTAIDRSITVLHNLEISVEDIVVRTETGFQRIELQKSEELSPRLEKEGSVKSLLLRDNEYISIRGVDHREMLINGSIIVKFIELPNFEQYAADNAIVFVKPLAAIQRGVFKVPNILDLEAVILKLRADKNVEEVELDSIDPTLQSQ